MRVFRELPCSLGIPEICRKWYCILVLGYTCIDMTLFHFSPTEQLDLRTCHEQLKNKACRHPILFLGYRSQFFSRVGMIMLEFQLCRKWRSWSGFFFCYILHIGQHCWPYSLHSLFSLFPHVPSSCFYNSVFFISLWSYLSLAFAKLFFSTL
jgi:hypothetical protein